jgi:hypothetical protein
MIVYTISDVEQQYFVTFACPEEMSSFHASVLGSDHLFYDIKAREVAAPIPWGPGHFCATGQYGCIVLGLERWIPGFWRENTSHRWMLSRVQVFRDLAGERSKYADKSLGPCIEKYQ